MNDLTQNAQGVRPVAQPHRRVGAKARAAQAGVAAAVFLILLGCPSSPAPVPCILPSPPAAITPARAGDVVLNGTLDCQYANGLLTGCALLPGASLDEFATSTLRGLAVTVTGSASSGFIFLEGY